MHTLTYKSLPVHEDIAFELGDLITQMRLVRGMTQEALSHKMDTQQSYLSRVERGKVEPSISFLKRVADATGCTLYMPYIERT